MRMIDNQKASARGRIKRDLHTCILEIERTREEEKKIVSMIDSCLRGAPSGLDNQLIGYMKLANENAALAIEQLQRSLSFLSQIDVTREVSDEQC